jgi:hypothetical protein
MTLLVHRVSPRWIFYFERVIRVLYRLSVRYEVATVATICAGLAAAWLIVEARTLTGFLPHRADLQHRRA